MIREEIPIVEEELETKEIGGFEDYPEQPVLTSKAEETIPA